MNLIEWRAKQTQGEEMLLPSGLEVRLKRVGVLDLAAQGEIPSTLEPQMNEVMREGRVKNITLDDFKNFAEMIDIVCQACLVWPPGLKTEELPYDDRVAIFTWANAAGSKLQPFRRQEDQPMEPSRTGNHVPSTSELLSGIVPR